jgi:hypothetical protein
MSVLTLEMLITGLEEIEEAYDEEFRFIVMLLRGDSNIYANVGDSEHADLLEELSKGILGRELGGADVRYAGELVSIEQGSCTLGDAGYSLEEDGYVLDEAGADLVFKNIFLMLQKIDNDYDFERLRDK